MLLNSYPTRLFVTLTIVAVILFALRFIGPAVDLYASVLIILLCAPGYMIALMMSLALSSRTAIRNNGDDRFRINTIESGLNTIAFIAVFLFTLQFLYF